MQKYKKFYIVCDTKIFFEKNAAKASKTLTAESLFTSAGRILKRFSIL